MKASFLFERVRLGILLFFASTFVVQAGLSGQDGQSSPKPQTQKLTQTQLEAIQIQMDSEDPIFVYDQSGGYRVAQPTQGPPDFQLFADGKVLVGGTNYAMPKIESKLSEIELTRFLHLVVNENRFYELDEKEIEKQMLAGNEKVKLMDAPTTRFSIALQRGKKDIAVYALWNAVKNFPEIEELKRLSAIERRCKSLITAIHLGDDGEQVLKAVNVAVAKLDRKIAPFTMDEIQNCTRLTSGRFQVRFQRELAPEKKSLNASTPPRNLNAIYFRSDANSEPKVSFYGLPQK